MDVSCLSDLNQHARAWSTCSDSRLAPTGVFPRLLRCYSWRSSIVKLPPLTEHHHENLCGGGSSFPRFGHCCSWWNFPSTHLASGGRSLTEYFECSGEGRNSGFRAGIGTQVLRLSFVTWLVFVSDDWSDMSYVKLFVLVWASTAINCHCKRKNI